MFTVVIVGPPNAGKSTLFNRLIGRHKALVHDTPGLTRDRHEGEGCLGELRFRVIDTAGFFGLPPRDELEAAIHAQTEEALRDAQVCLFLMDGSQGVTPLEEMCAQFLRLNATPCLMVVNKCDKRDVHPEAAAALGLGVPLGISAAHGTGMDALREALISFAPPSREREHKGVTMKIVIAGRPNVGKSTLVNALLGEERMVTGPRPGVTRDAVGILWSDSGGSPVTLFDTAGVRRAARVQQTVEHLSVSRALQAVRFAEIVVIVMDALSPFERQDLRLAALVEREGRAVLLALNKSDLLTREARLDRQRALREQVDIVLPQLRGVPAQLISARTGAGLGVLMKEVRKAWDVWNSRVPTAKLNSWLVSAVRERPPPYVGRRRIRLKYITQARTRPPTFILFASRHLEEALPVSYRRYLVSGLRRAFGLWGVPIRLRVRVGDNPYEH